MKKYKNITKTTLAIDVYTRTIYIKPGEIATLPMTRDVRYYSRISYLVVVKDRDDKEKLGRVSKFKKRPKSDKPKKKKGRKSKKVEDKEEKEEKLNEMENN